MSKKFVSLFNVRSTRNFADIYSYLSLQNLPKSYCLCKTNFYIFFKFSCFLSNGMKLESAKDT